MTTVLKFGYALILIHCLASSALGVALQSDPAGISGFTGFQNYANGTMSARLEYAVYAPTQYATSVNAGVDPSAGARYVYAYQIFNTSMDTPISVSTIGQSPKSAATLAQNAGSDAANVLSADGSAPLLPIVASASVIYNFLSPEMPAGGKSTVLIYTSPFGPHYTTATVSSGGNTDVHPVPSPLPEPATAAVFALLALVFTARIRGRLCALR